MENITLSFTDGEIIKAGTVLELKTTRPTTLKAAGSAITLRSGLDQIRPEIRLKDESTIQISTSSFPPGPYSVTVSRFLDQENAILTSYAIVTFVVGALRGTIPSELRVGHAVYLAVGDLTSERLAAGAEAPPDTKYVEIVKAINRQTGEFQKLAFDAQGKPIDPPQKDLIELEKRRRDKYGRLSPTLYDKLETLQGSDQVDVVVWPIIDFDLTAYDKPTDGEQQGASPQEKELMSRIGTAHLKALTDKGIKFEQLRNIPTARTTIDVNTIRDLATADDVGYIDYEDKENITDLGVSLAVSRASNLKNGNSNITGSGVKVGVWETGPKDISDLKYEKRYWNEDKDIVDSKPIWHPRLTSAIIKNTKSGEPNGYAPKCMLYGANDFNSAALDWAIDEGCTVISQSFHNTSDAQQGVIQLLDTYTDSLANSDPYPFFSQAAGNIGGDAITPANNEYVNHKGYNGLKVGNHDDTATNMNSTSVFRNPITTHNDRELPEICANGTTVSWNGITDTGTSFAAPAVAGTAALLQQQDPTLKKWPEAMRAILLCGAGRKISGNTWWTDVVNGPKSGKSGATDVGDGAGCLNTDVSDRITRTRIDNPNNAPTPFGWTFGNLELKTSFDAIGKSKFVYRMQAKQSSPPPNSSKPETRVFKVVLAWAAKSTFNIFDISGPTFGFGSVLGVDFDLEVVDTNLKVHMPSSLSYDNNYEIVEFTGSVNTIYEISFRMASRADWVERNWFGLAWRNRLVEEI